MGQLRGRKPPDRQTLKGAIASRLAERATPQRAGHGVCPSFPTVHVPVETSCGFDPASHNMWQEGPVRHPSPQQPPRQPVRIQVENPRDVSQPQPQVVLQAQQPNSPHNPRDEIRDRRALVHRTHRSGIVAPP
eukprot:3933713-Rhodomonas_salina.2